MQRVRKAVSGIARAFWAQMQENMAMRAGVPVDLDPCFTHDKFIQSPLISETVREDYSVTETTKIHETHRA